MTKKAFLRFPNFAFISKNIKCYSITSFVDHITFCHWNVESRALPCWLIYHHVNILFKDVIVSKVILNSMSTFHVKTNSASEIMESFVNQGWKN